MKCFLTGKKNPFSTNVLLSMKLTAAFLLLFALNVSARGFGQEKINLNLKKTQISDVLLLIEKQTSYRFLYNNDLEDIRDKVTINVKDAALTDVLAVLLQKTRLHYQVMNQNLIVIKEDPVATVPDEIIHGRVTGDGGVPLASVSVVVKGSTNGTVTNNAGEFTLTVPDANVTLVFSIVGYDTQEIPLDGKTDITVSMNIATQSLDQVVVVGYGASRRRDLTGSIASVKGADIARQPVQTATQAVQGKIAGVQIISSGEPNTLPKVRIRGTGSTLGGVEPLYVVDGVITDDIRNINSADIVSLDVLKDASATAIYGMRAANGVMIITTKKGRRGKTVFSYDANVGVREATNLVNMAGENQYAGYLNEASVYYGSGDSLVPASRLTGSNTDWYDVILRNAFQQNHNLSLSGGSDRITYFLSAGFLSEDGIMLNNKFNRFTLRSNNEYTLSQKLKLSTLVSYSRSDANGANFGSFNEAYRAAPTVPSKIGGKYGNTSEAGNIGNPLLDIEKNHPEVLENRVQGTFALEYKPINWLTFRSSAGVDLSFTRSTTYAYKYASDTSTFITGGGNQQRSNSQLTLGKNDANKWVWDNTVTLARTFDKHSLTVLAGVTAERYKFNSEEGTAKDVPENEDQWFLNAGTNGTQTVTNTGDKWTRNSYLGRLNYSYDSRYLLTATIRADGTSRFSQDNRWGYFPSFGVGWNLAQENFMSGQKIFDDLKLRGSWGRVGNDNIPTSLYYSIATTNVPYYFDGSRYLGITFDNINDKNLKWEITNELDFGIDFTTLGKRLNGQIDYYNKKTKDALTYVNLPAILGDDRYITNAATFENKGVELGLTWTDKIGSDWSYSVSGNIAYNKNKILSLNGGQALFDGSVGNYLVTKSDNGQAIGSFFVLQADGIFQSEEEVSKSAQKDARPGDLRYKDISGPNGVPDGAINDFDRAYSGSYQPKLTFGLNGNVGYKGFDLSFGAYGTSGGKIYNGKKAVRGTDARDNIETEVVKNRWTPDRPNTNVPRATTGLLPASTYFIESSDFFRLNNLTLGYTLNNSSLDKIKVTSLRIYVTAQNLFTITPYSGFTPEIFKGDGTPLNGGIEFNTYPSTRTFAFGVNLGF